MSDVITDQSERRRFFRIDDQIILHYSVIPAEELPRRQHELASGLPDHFTVMASLSAIGRDMKAQLRHIKSRDPEVGAFLSSMDEKIDLLSRALFASNEGLASEVVQSVNISASGISFTTDKAIDINSIIEAKMILFPTFAGILSYGKVVRCDAISLDEYEIAVDFAFMADDDRELLIRHILGKQHQLLKARAEA